MHKYFFKIKKNDVEFEFGTDDLFEFDKRVLSWVENICSTKNNQNGEEVHKDDINVKSIVEFDGIRNKEFENILNDAINNPKTIVKAKVDSNDRDNKSLDLFLEQKKPQTQLQKLMTIAYFIENSENISPFSIKQINSKIFPIYKTPIDHKIINEALEKNLLCVSIEKVKEEFGFRAYNLTKEGKNYIEKSEFCE